MKKTTLIVIILLFLSVAAFSFFYLTKKKNNVELQQPEETQKTITPEETRKMEIDFSKKLEETEGRDYNAFKDLANLYLSEGRYDEAVALIESMRYISRKKILFVKKDFYKAYADYLYSDKQYKESLAAYNKALAYRKRYNKRIPRDDIKESIYNNYLELSLEAAKQDDYSSAINYLNTALNYKKVAEVYYKLAILYRNTDLKTSINYFEKTQKLDPLIINYDLYMKTLEKIKHQSKEPTDFALYSIKQRELKRFVNSIIIAPNEIEIKYKNPVVRKEFFSDEKTVEFNFTITNNAEYILRQLYCQIELSENDEVISTIDMPVITKENIVPIKETSEPIKVSFSVPKDKKFFMVKIYATKNKKIPLELISTKSVTFSK